MWATLILGLAQLGYGAYQKSKAKKAYDAIGDANYDISQQYYDNVGLAENLAQTGWSQDSTNYFTQQLQQGLQSSTSAILQAGGGINDFSKAYSNFTNGVKSFSLEGDKLRQSNLARLFQERSALAREETQQWAINKYKKNQDQKAAAAQWLAGANNTMNQGLNTTIQGASQVGQYYMSDKAPGYGSKSNPYLLENEATTKQPTFFTDPNQNNFGYNAGQPITQNLYGNGVDVNYNANLWGNPQIPQ